MYHIEGILKDKKETKEVSSNFKVREFIVTESSGSKEEHIQFQLTQENCRLLDHFEVGTALKVGFYIGGREYTSSDGDKKYFNTFKAVQLESSIQTNSSEPLNTSSLNTTDSQNPSEEDKEDDLPF